MPIYQPAMVNIKSVISNPQTHSVFQIKHLHNILALDRFLPYDDKTNSRHSRQARLLLPNYSHTFGFLGWVSEIRKQRFDKCLLVCGNGFEGGCEIVRWGQWEEVWEDSSGSVDEFISRPSGLNFARFRIHVKEMVSNWGDRWLEDCRADVENCSVRAIELKIQQWDELIDSRHRSVQTL